MKLLRRTSLLVGALVLAVPATAQQATTQREGQRPAGQRESSTQAAQPEQTKKAGEKIRVAHVFRTSTIEGMEVRNAQNEDLGTVQELVVDISTGEVKYAALSFGGVLGIGDKLFAVPWKALTLKSGENDRYFVLNVDKQKLEQAKGFNQNQWPDMADPTWAKETDTFYQAQRSDKNTDSQRR